jgi:hypothetical protein
MTMSEYEDRYPEAYGRHEEIEARPMLRVQHDDPAVARRPRPIQHVERPRRPLVERTPRAICEDVTAQLTTSPFIDASGIVVTVDGSEVTLTGTINSLIAIALAKALTSNVPGVSRVQVQLRVQQATRLRDGGRAGLSDRRVGT